jgi:hypothetical protein
MQNRPKLSTYIYIHVHLKYREDKKSATGRTKTTMRNVNTISVGKI